MNPAKLNQARAPSSNHEIVHGQPFARIQDNHRSFLVRERMCFTALVAAGMRLGLSPASGAREGEQRSNIMIICRL